MPRFSRLLAGAGALSVWCASMPAPAMPIARHAIAVRGHLQTLDAARWHDDVRDLGRIGREDAVRVGIVMRDRHESELEPLTIAQSNRNSPYFHRYLSLAQWNAYFAPDEATYARTQSLLRRAGFRIEQTFANRGLIRAIAPARVAEAYFQTQFHRFSQRNHGLRYANVTPAIVPAELRDAASTVLGLDSIVNVHFPLHFAKEHRRRVVVRNPVRPRDERAPATDATAAAATPNPASTSTPAANPSPDPTEVPGNPVEEYVTDAYLGYGPPIFADAYDYPVQHGYGGSGRAAGSVIDSDFSDADSAIQYSTFGIPRTTVNSGANQNTFRRCTDPNGACTICDDSTAASTTATCDPEGESTLDAQTIMSLAPKAKFYEYLVNSADSLDDLDVDAAYEAVVSDDIVDAVNSSFGGCETDDPAGLYAENVVAMEGAAEGITFSASAGDTGGTSCGLYAGNGTPQSEISVSAPAAAPYFTAVGGTSFEMLTRCSGTTGTDCYTTEAGWLNGGGGVSVYEPQPPWQDVSFVNSATNTIATGVGGLEPTTEGRDVPDLAFTADPEMGVPEAVTYEGETEGIGGTSLSSPMWVAMQTEINQVQKSRHGLVGPSLYAIAAAEYKGLPLGGYTFAFRDISVGNNIPYETSPGYDLVTGIGSPLGWELAGVE